MRRSADHCFLLTAVAIHINSLLPASTTIPAYSQTSSALETAPTPPTAWCRRLDHAFRTPRQCASVARELLGGLDVAQGGLGEEVGELLHGRLGVARGRPQLGRQPPVCRLQRVERRLRAPSSSSPSAMRPADMALHMHFSPAPEQPHHPRPSTIKKGRTALPYTKPSVTVVTTAPRDAKTIPNQPQLVHATSRAGTVCMFKPGGTPSSRAARAP